MQVAFAASDPLSASLDSLEVIIEVGYEFYVVLARALTSSMIGRKLESLRILYSDGLKADIQSVVDQDYVEDTGKGWYRREAILIQCIC